MSDKTIADAMTAKAASLKLATMSSVDKNHALGRIAQALRDNQDCIIEANQKDMAAARETDLPMPLRKRLLFDEKKIRDVVSGVESLMRLEDPVGHEQFCTELSEGLILRRITCPLGVVGVIFESRPDALVQIATLCLKSGNAAILKGGSEALHTNRILRDVMCKAVEETEATNAAGTPPNGWMSLWETRDQVETMLQMHGYIDLIIPRGSNEFVQAIMKKTSIPVMGHADGVCHLYIHSAADPRMAVRLAVDSKTQYVSVCNAAETLLIDRSAIGMLPDIIAALREKGVVIHGCEETRKVVDAEPVEDWHHEYLGYEISVKIVDDLEDAVRHIHAYGSGHTECIVTSDADAAKAFLSSVDAGNVFHNCSTRFSDGFRYGFGAEVGISTSKLHARGPVGLDGLVTYKYVVQGDGHIVADFEEGRAVYTHKKIPNP